MLFHAMLWTLRTAPSRILNIRTSLRPSRQPFSFTSNYRFPRIAKPSSTTPPPPPSFQHEVAKATPEVSFGEGVKAPSIRNQVMVSSLFSSCDIRVEGLMLVFHLRVFRSVLVCCEANKYRDCRVDEKAVRVGGDVEVQAAK